LTRPTCLLLHVSPSRVRRWSHSETLLKESRARDTGSTSTSDTSPLLCDLRLQSLALRWPGHAPRRVPRRRAGCLQRLPLDVGCRGRRARRGNAPVRPPKRPLLGSGLKRNALPAGGRVRVPRRLLCGELPTPSVTLPQGLLKSRTRLLLGWPLSPPASPRLLLPGRRRRLVPRRLPARRLTAAARAGWASLTRTTSGTHGKPSTTLWSRLSTPAKLPPTT